MAPGEIPPRQRLPITRSYPPRSFATKGASAQKVVTLIQVPHDDVFTFRGGNPGGQGCPIPTDRHRNNTRVQPRRQVDRCIGAPLSATSTSPLIRYCSRNRCALATQAARVPERAFILIYGFVTRRVLTGKISGTAIGRRSPLFSFEYHPQIEPFC